MRDLDNLDEYLDYLEFIKAALLSQNIKLRMDVNELLNAIEKWSSRPTKDGAKRLRELARSIEIQNRPH
jgi:hypothetical protein